MGDPRPARHRGLDHRRPHIELRPLLEANLRAFERVASTQAQRPAAVAVVVLENAGTPCVPIFQRPSGMRRHASQMALPGGRVHEGETVEGCALRELEEELGLKLEQEDVIGLLDDFDTRSGFTITPVVVWSGALATQLSPSSAEVAHLFIVPTTDLQAAVSSARPGPSKAFSLKLSQVEVFAPTAAMLYQFAEVGLEGRSVRVADFYQPPWTHH